MSDGGTVPLWVAVLVPFISGAAGAVGAAYWTGRTAREERWRERLIAAAESFHTPLIGAFRAYRNAASLAQGGTLDESFTNEVTSAARHADEARDLELKLFLLFGGHSPVTQAAAYAVAAIDDIPRAMLDPEWTVASVDKALTDAQAKTIVFADRAHDAIWVRPKRWRGETIEAALERLESRERAEAASDPIEPADE